MVRSAHLPPALLLPFRAKLESDKFAQADLPEIEQGSGPARVKARADLNPSPMAGSWPALAGQDDLPLCPLSAGLSTALKGQRIRPCSSVARAYLLQQRPLKAASTAQVFGLARLG